MSRSKHHSHLISYQKKQQQKKGATSAQGELFACFFCHGRYQQACHVIFLKGRLHDSRSATLFRATIRLDICLLSLKFVQFSVCE